MKKDRKERVASCLFLIGTQGITREGRDLYICPLYEIDIEFLDIVAITCFLIDVNESAVKSIKIWVVFECFQI